MSLGTGLTLKPVLGPGGGGGGGVSYLLRDEFLTDRAAGSLNGTSAEPGPGTRIVTDTGNRLSISGGKLTAASGGTYGDPGLWLGGISRAAGRLLKAQGKVTTSPLFVGWDQDTASSQTIGLAFMSSSNLQIWDPAFAQFTVESYALSTDYEVVMVLRSAGAYVFIKGGVYTNWTLLFVGFGTSNFATAYASLSGTSGAWTSDYLRVPSDLWLPTPIAYDTFTRADGSLGSTETTGPDGQSCTARTWTTQLGTVAVSGNKAKATALSGGRAIATIEGSKANVAAALALTRGTTGAGLIVRYVDNSNYWYWTHDGTNAKLVKRVADTETTKITSAQTYSAGASGVVVADGSAWRLVYNNALTGTVTDSDLSTATKAGLIFFDTDSTVDNFQLFARGTGGEYAVLDNF
jgi:hypothetical protein